MLAPSVEHRHRHEPERFTNLPIRLAKDGRPYYRNLFGLADHHTAAKRPGLRTHGRILRSARNVAL